MKLLISPRLRQNSPLEVDDQFTGHHGTISVSDRKTDGSMFDVSGYPMVQESFDPVGIGGICSAATSLKIIRWYLDERASSSQYEFYRRLKA